MAALTPEFEKIWTTVGSAGVLDEASVGKVFFDHGIVQMGRPLGDTVPVAKSTVGAQQTQSAVIRYNVTPTNGLFTLQPGPCTAGCAAYKLHLRYLAAGSHARVVARLIEIDMATGAETVRLSFESSPTSNHYEVRSGPFDCGPTFSFDFVGKAYYIEAVLTSSTVAAGSAAGIQVIKVQTDTCL